MMASVLTLLHWQQLYDADDGAGNNKDIMPHIYINHISKSDEWLTFESHFCFR